MTIRLRPHHLLCMLTYAGKGYSPAFTDNMTAIVKRIAGGEPIAIVSGPDDICKPLLAEPDPHCHRESVTARDRVAWQDVTRLLGVPVSSSCMSLTEDQLGTFRRDFRDKKIRAACHGCEWQDLCGNIAGDDFAGTTLKENGRKDAKPA